MTDQGSLPALSETFLQAAVDPGLWHDALDRMAYATGSLRAQLIGIDPHGEMAFNVMTASDEAMLLEFQQVSGLHDVATNFRIASSAAAAPGSLVWEDHYDDVRNETGDSAYAELCEKHGKPFGCQAALAVEDGALVGLALMRSRAEGRTTAEHRTFFAAAAGAAQTALRIQRSIEGRGAALLQGTLELIGTPVLLIDGFGMVAGMTGAAEAFVASHPALDVRKRMLVTARASETLALHRALRSVLDRKRLDVSVLVHSPGSLPLLVTIQALPDVEMGFGIQPRALVTLGGGASKASNTSALLREYYHLTPSEVEVVLQLARGMRRREIAQSRNTSLGTVQQQIKAAFAKTGVHRETELVALVAALGT